MKTEEKAKFDLVQEIAKIRSGEREGPVNERSVYRYINETPALLSLLYDINYMPEQLEEHSRKWCYMERIVCAWCRREMEIAEKGKTIRAVRREAIEDCIAKIRADCQACGGTGVERYEPPTFVSREMALDAEQPEREGSLYSAEVCEECEYCGRPIASIRALLKEHE